MDEVLIQQRKCGLYAKSVGSGPRNRKLRLIASFTRFAIELRLISIVRLIATLCETGSRTPGWVHIAPSVWSADALEIACYQVICRLLKIKLPYWIRILFSFPFCLPLTLILSVFFFVHFVRDDSPPPPPPPGYWGMSCKFYKSYKRVSCNRSVHSILF